jgi:hypothetical protein
LSALMYAISCGLVWVNEPRTWLAVLPPVPADTLQKSLDRVRAAVTNCGNSWPMARLTLALSPATLPK